MWISRKRLNLLEKRVADLEEKVQSQPKEIITMISRHQKEQMTKSYRPRDPWGRKSRPDGQT